MKKIIVLRGIPASGKSTFTRDLSKSMPQGTVARINNDDLVASMFPAFEWGTVDGITDLLATVRLSLLETLLASPRVEIIVIDNTNLWLDGVREYERIANRNGAAFEVFDGFLTVPVEECLTRDAQRANPVGKQVIDRMARTAAALRPYQYAPTTIRL